MHGALKLLVAAEHTGSPFSVLIYFEYFAFLTVYTCLYVGVSCECRCSGRKAALDLLELEFQVTMSCPCVKDQIQVCFRSTLNTEPSLQPLEDYVC